MVQLSAQAAAPAGFAASAATLTDSDKVGLSCPFLELTVVPVNSAAAEIRVNLGHAEDS